MAIHYVVNTQQMPANGVEAVNEAIDQVSRATGLAFVSDGFTSRRPAGTIHPRTAHGTYAPVLIAWATGRQFSPVAGNAGVTFPAPVHTGTRGVDRYVSGEVVLHAGVFADLAADDHEDRERAIIMHELGHLVGLGHVNDRDEIMNPTSVAWAFGPGDLQGLAEAGSGRCTY
jgi:hypothetical protein